jgi:glycosyltransferase involved in cell wall biosynthesis
LQDQAETQGFGLPTIEAQLNSCPVALSDIEVFREIGGDSVEYFDPQDADHIAKSISRAIDRRILLWTPAK